MTHGKHYSFTYAPVASWTTIRLILTIAAMFKWPTRQLDYVLAFPQAPNERELYMTIQKGYKVHQGKTSDHVLKLKNNLYLPKTARLSLEPIPHQKVEEHRICAIGTR